MSHRSFKAFSFDNCRLARDFAPRPLYFWYRARSAFASACWLGAGSTPPPPPLPPQDDDMHSSGAADMPHLDQLPSSAGILPSLKGGIMDSITQHHPKTMGGLDSLPKPNPLKLKWKAHFDRDTFGRKRTITTAAPSQQPTQQPTLRPPTPRQTFKALSEYRPQ